MQVHEPFFGRQAEIEEIVKELVMSVKVVYISGPPGIGKSAMAHELCKIYCKKVETLFQAKNRWICLRSEITDFKSLCTSMTQDLPNSGTGTFPEQDSIHLANQVIKGMPLGHILVLDACEHISDPKLVSQFIQTVAATNKDIRIILTSQIDMSECQLPHPGGVYVEVLQELTCKESEQILEDVGSCLDQPSCKAGIAQKCCGLPLALVLARTLIDKFDFNICDLCKQLDQGVEVLSCPKDSYGQRSLGKVFDTFFDRLKTMYPDAYGASLAVSMFEGPFTHRDFIAVATEDPQLQDNTGAELLSTIRKFFIVTRFPTHEYQDQVRYEMHPLLRQYAKKLLVERQDFYHLSVVKFLQHYSNVVQNYVRTDKQGDIRYPAQDLPNIQAFLNRLNPPMELGLGGLDESSSEARLNSAEIIRGNGRLLDCLVATFGDEAVGQFLSRYFGHHLRLSTYEALIKCADALPRSTTVGMLLEKARIKRGKNEYDDALRDATEVYEICENTVPNVDLKTSCLELLGSIKARKRPWDLKGAEVDLEQCSKMLEKAIQTARRGEDKERSQLTKRLWRLASVCLKLLEVYINRNDQNKACGMFVKCNEAFLEASPDKERMFQARIHQRMSTLFNKGGKKSPEKELEYLKEARVSLEKGGLTSHILYGQVCYRLGCLLGRSSETLDDSLKMFEKSESVQEQPWMDPHHESLAKVYLDHGQTLLERAKPPKEDIEKAQDLFEKSGRIWKTHGAKWSSRLAQAYQNTAEASCILGLSRKAIEYFRLALDLYDSEQCRHVPGVARNQKKCRRRIEEIEAAALSGVSLT